MSTPRLFTPPSTTLPETLPLLVQACEDTRDYGAILYCARRRQMRPQGAWFAKGYYDASVMPLFAACGPEREVGYGNPHMDYL